MTFSVKTTFESDKEYKELIKQYLAIFESFKPTVYDDKLGSDEKDKAGTGKLTIGHGFNIEERSVVAQVLTTVFNVKINKQIVDLFLAVTKDSLLKVSEQQTKLDELLTSITNGAFTSFSLTESQSSAVLDELIKDAISEVDKVLTFEELPRSAERAVLVSFAYNQPALLGDNLINAIKAGNRAAAWFEIRYNSNGNVEASNRRYIESALFGLYQDVSNVSASEAQDIISFLTANNNAALNQIHKEENEDNSLSLHHAHYASQLIAA